MKWIFKILAVGLAVGLPLLSLSLSMNIVLRMPDVYEYNFKATENLADIGIEKSDEEMGRRISDFMLMKRDSLSDTEEDGQFKLSEPETEKLLRWRGVVNGTAVMALLSVVISVAAIVFFKKKELDEELRRQLKKGIYLYLYFGLLYCGIYIVLSKAGYPVHELLTGSIPSETVLKQLMGPALVRVLYFAVAIVATVIMGILAYIVKSITKPKRIFSRTYY